MKKVLVRPSIYWKLMCWWVKIIRGSRDNIQVGTVFYGGSLLIAFFFDSPGERKVVSQTSLTKAQALHFYEELGRQIERFDAFGAQQR